MHPSHGIQTLDGAMIANITKMPKNVVANSTLKELGVHPINEVNNSSTPISLRLTSAIKTTSSTTKEPSTKAIDPNETEKSHPGIKFQSLSVACVAAFLFISNVGWVALNQVICAELLPREIHRTANILIVGFSFLSAFISIKMFVDLVESLDAGHTFYLFGSICLLAALFTLFFVPETSQS